MTKDLVPSNTASTNLSSFDALAPLSSKALFWRAGYVRKSPFLEHIPLLFWVIENARPNMVVSLGISDAVPYFAACQAVDKLNIETLCFATEAKSDTNLDQVINYNTQNYPDFSEIVIDSPANLALTLQNSEIDLLIVNEPLTQTLADEIDTIWLASLSGHALILFTKGGDPKILANYTGRIALDGGRFIADPARGIQLVIRGRQHNDRLMRLAGFMPGKLGYLNVKQVFSRIGELHKASFELEHSASALTNTRKQRDAHLAELTKKQEKLEAQEEKLTQIVDHLKSARSQIATSRSEAFDQKSALDAATEELAQSRTTTQELLKTIADLEAAHFQTEKRIEDHRVEKTTLEADRDNDKQRIAELQAQTHSLIEDHRALEHQAETNAATLAQRDNELAALIKIHEAQTDTIMQSRQQLDALSAERGTLTQNIQELLNTVRAREETCATIARARDAALESAEKRYSELGILTGENEALSSRFDEIVRQCEALKAEGAKARAAEDRQTNEIAILTGILEQRDNDIHRQAGSLSASQAEIESTKKLLAKAWEDLEKTKALLEREKLNKTTLLKLANAKEEIALAISRNRVSKAYRSVRENLDRQITLVRDSGLFDEKWYGETYPDIAASALSAIEHFVQMGAYEGRNPGPDFDSMTYHLADPKIATAKMPALLHYLRYGKDEGRRAVPVQQ